MNFEQLVGFFIVVPAALFAGFMTWFSPQNGSKTNFMTYLLEGVTIEASAVLILACFSTRLFEWVGDNRIFISLVALSTLMYAARDIVARVGRSAVDKENRSDRKSNV